MEQLKVAYWAFLRAERMAVPMVVMMAGMTVAWRVCQMVVLSVYEMVE